MMDSSASGSRGGSSRAATRAVQSWEEADVVSAGIVFRAEDRVGRVVPGVTVEMSDSSLDPVTMESRGQPPPKEVKVFLRQH